MANGGNVQLLPPAASKADMILMAVTAEVERWRHVINADSGLQRIVVTVHLASGFGHPREVECDLKSGKRLAIPQNS